ncbi:MAG TPA: SDR family NAD(P)-dependent oxidoreductase [Ignavibacteria bacterium]|jgi:short-subunit dehydrogenase
MNNKYKNVLLIGASQGIGKALATEYAKHGSNLVISSRNSDVLKKISEEINSQGGNCLYFQCDVTKLAGVSKTIQFASEKLGSIDLAIINSGVGGPRWMDAFSSSDFIRILEVNTFGIAHSLECLIPLMMKQGYGTIAGVTSMADSRGYPGSSGYGASKAAASMLLESARVELKKHNIKVITVRPGFVRTAMTAKNEFKMPLLMEPEKAARKIRKGIEKGRSVVQFPWPIVWATRIIKNVPNWLYDWGTRLYRPGINHKP